MSQGPFDIPVRLVRPAVPLPGRKKRLTRTQPTLPLSPDAVRQKNRDAQRAHRDRVSRKISDLESEVVRLRVRVNELEEENGNLKGELGSSRRGPNNSGLVNGMTAGSHHHLPPFIVKSDSPSCIDIKPSPDVDILTPAASRHPSSSPTIAAGDAMSQITNAVNCGWSQSSTLPSSILTTSSSEQQRQQAAVSTPVSASSTSPSSLADAMSFSVFSHSPMPAQPMMRRPSSMSSPASPFIPSISTSNAHIANKGYPAGPGPFQLISHQTYPSPPTPTSLAVCSPVLTSPASAATTVSPISPFFIANSTVHHTMSPVDAFGRPHPAMFSPQQQQIMMQGVGPQVGSQQQYRAPQMQQFAATIPAAQLSPNSAAAGAPGSCASSLLGAAAEYVANDWRVASM